MSAPDYGRAFAAWRRACGADWDAYARHPFVEGMRDGTLPREAFHHYLVQDYVFLVHFARAWALAVVKSETMEEMRTAAATVDALVNMEMSLHVQTCAGLGISEDRLFAAPESPANLAYTRYVMDAGIAGDLCDLLAALAPCVLGYGEIGARLGAEAGDTPYADWIAAYAGDDYQAVCRDVGAMIDAALARRLGTPFTAAPRWDRVTERFRMATRLEAGFWQMGLDLA
ncbi:thiaminase II [Mangrovicoccus algicola]|uniref:Aminopyrimidine aminohydrolase n=1 Tax=Mangrovicoccus algicola TaxID=2771008 RepID=A0A8J6Z9S2_9RHOB|nr:thiaminase II [Mangrovicoccus algicola]MBE3638651.1 thiaminase II [Mangrovicoccus algicola]